MLKDSIEGLKENKYIIKYTNTFTGKQSKKTVSSVTEYRARIIFEGHNPYCLIDSIEMKDNVEKK